MSMNVRRVVTGNDISGKSVAIIDDIAQNGTSRRRGHDSRVIWVTDGETPPNVGSDDASACKVGRPPPAGVGGGSAGSRPRRGARAMRALVPWAM